MNYELEGKTAIVTGGTAGVGEAVVKMLLEEGANVVFCGRKRTPEIEEKVASFNQSHTAQTKMVEADVSKEEDINRLFDITLDTFGTVDIIVNNAGIWPTAFVKDMEVNSFRETLEVNLLGPFMLCKRMVNYCLDHHKKGKIINMVSQAAFHGSTSGHAHYASSKAGLVGFTISLAREVAPFGINVNAVAPGIIETKLVSAIVDNPERREKYLERIPLRKIATSEDVAKIVLFLASSQSDYMTGATLDATGGMLMR